MSDQPVASLAEIRRLMGELRDADLEAASAAAGREATLTKPPGSLGRLEEISSWLCAWQGRHDEARVAFEAAAALAGNRRDRDLMQRRASEIL